MERFQGKCLRSYEGWQFMTVFDRFPPVVQERLRNSPFNLCCACVWEMAHVPKTASEYLKTIDRMEAQIRREDKNV